MQVPQQLGQDQKRPGFGRQRMTRLLFGWEMLHSVHQMRCDEPFTG